MGEIKFFFHIFSFMQLDIDVAGPECLARGLVTFENKWWFKVLLPFVVMFVVLIVILLGLCCANCGGGKKRNKQKSVAELVKKGKHISQKMKKKKSGLLEDLSHNGRTTKAITYLVKAFINVVALCYIMMTKAAMSIFSCYFPEGDDTGASFMVAQPSEPCWTEDGLQFALIAPAVLVILFYSLGYPVGLWTLYHNNRHIILRDQLLKAAGKGYSIKTNKDIHFRRRYGILYSYFKPTHYWWVLMFIGRKFFVSAFAVGLRNYPTFQLASMLLVMFCCLLIQVRQRPFLDTRERAELLIDLNQKKLVYANSLIAHMNVFARAHHQDMNIESDRMRKLRKRITNFEAVIKSLRLQLLNHDTWWWNLNTLEETLSTGAVVLMLAGITFDTTFVKNSPNVRVIIALVMASLLIIMIVFYIMSFVHEYKNEKKVRNSRKVLPAGLEVKREAAAKEAEKTHLANMLGTREARVSIARQASIGGGRQSNSLSRKISLQAPILSSYNDELNSNAATRSQGGTLSRQSTHHVENVDDLLDLFGGDSNDAGGMGFDLDDLFDDENVMNGDAEKGLDFMNVCMEPTHDQNGGSGFNIDSFLESGTTFERKS